MRTRKFELDGFAVIIAPLNVVQVEHFIEMKPAQTDLKCGQVREWTLELICDSLNNAGRLTNGNAWTPDRVLLEMDTIYIQKLQEEIFSFTGLEWKVPRGEEQAPSQAQTEGAWAQKSAA